MQHYLKAALVRVLANQVYNAWRDLTDQEIAQEYEWEYPKVKSVLGDVFPTSEDFKRAVREGKVISLSKAADRQIGYRSHTEDLEELKDLVSGYRYPRDVDRIVNGFENNDPLPYPIILEMGGRRRVMSGNTRLDTAFILGISPKVLVVQVPSANKITSSVSALVSRFKKAFQKPSLVKEWDSYVKNPEMPDFEIHDPYGGWEEDDDHLEDPQQKIDNALEKVPHKKGVYSGDEWEKDVARYLKIKFKEWLEDFKSDAKFKGGKLQVYRTLTTHGDNEELIESWDDPNWQAGVYWSWKPYFEAPWGGRGRVATMIALIGPESIDFEKSLVKNLHPTLGDEETEIELKPGATVEIIALQEGSRHVIWKGKKTVKA